MWLYECYFLNFPFLSGCIAVANNFIGYLHNSNFCFGISITLNETSIVKVADVEILPANIKGTLMTPEQMNGKLAVREGRMFHWCRISNNFVFTYYDFF